MKNIFKFLFVIFIVALIHSCSDDDGIKYDKTVNWDHTPVNVSQSVTHEYGNEFTVTFNPEGNGTLYWAVLPAETEAPTAAELRATFGPATGDVITGYIAGGLESVTNGQTIVKVVTEGQVDTTYKVYSTIANSYDYANGNVAVDEITPDCEYDFSNFAVGNYTVSSVTPGFYNGQDSFGADVPVTVRIDPENPIARSFEAVYLPGAGVGQDPMTFSFHLDCGHITIPGTYESGLSCGESAITLGSSEETSEFNYLDDSEILITFLDNAGSACGSDPAVVTIKLTKVVE